jgi:type I restriction-modification system DNA methylase subunit
MEIINVGIVFLIGFVLGEVYLAFRIQRVLEDMVEAALEEEAEEESVVEVYKLKTEVTDNSILLYDEQGLFLCQGNTLQELATLVKERSGIEYAAVMHNNKIFMFMDGVVKETI